MVFLELTFLTLKAIVTVIVSNIGSSVSKDETKQNKTLCVLYNPSFRIASGTARSYIGQSSPGHSDGECYWLNEVAILVVSAILII